MRTHTCSADTLSRVVRISLAHKSLFGHNICVFCMEEVFFVFFCLFVCCCVCFVLVVRYNLPFPKDSPQWCSTHKQKGSLCCMQTEPFIILFMRIISIVFDLNTVAIRQDQAYNDEGLDDGRWAWTTWKSPVSMHSLCIQYIYVDSTRSLWGFRMVGRSQPCYAICMYRLDGKAGLWLLLDPPERITLFDTSECLMLYRIICYKRNSPLSILHV